MIKAITILFSLLCFSTAFGAQQIPRSFSHLSKMDVGEAKGYIFIYFNASKSKIFNQTIESISHPGTALRALETKIDSAKEEIYTIDYDAGPSGDPHFVIHRKIDGNFVMMGSFTGTELIVPGDGSVYVSGKADDYFNKRRKYLLKNGLLKEVVQPYYYVGMKGVNSRPLDLYTDTSYTEKVAHLPVNSEVEVLLAKSKDNFNYDFLIKTPYGLLGWAFFSDMCGSEIIKDICFHGD